MNVFYSVKYAICFNVAVVFMTLPKINEACI